MGGSVDGGSDSSTTMGSGWVSGIISRFAGLPFRAVVAAACPKFDVAVMISGSVWVSGISCLTVRGLPRLPRDFSSFVSSFSVIFAETSAVIDACTGLLIVAIAPSEKPLSSDKISKSSSISSSSSLSDLLFVISSKGCLLLDVGFLMPAAFAPNTEVDGARLMAVVALIFGRPGRRFAGAFSLDSVMVKESEFVSSNRSFFVFMTLYVVLRKDMFTISVRM